MNTADMHDRFHINGLFARGGMADLWLAQDADSQPVVLKTVRSDLSRSTSVCSAFRREIGITARLDHQHIVHHVAHGTWNGRDALVLEHISGVALDHLGRERLPLGPALLIALDVAEALDYVHTLGDEDGVPLDIVHGDVSPQNVVVDTSGQALLIDFGAVTMRAMRKSQQLICKPGYMSPEQSHGLVVDARTDQYALGVVLWELLTGEDLFCGDGARRDRAIAPISAFTSIPPAVEATVIRMLAPEPELRFPGMNEVARALRALIPIPIDARSWLATSARAAPPQSDARSIDYDVDTVPMRGRRGWGPMLAPHRPYWETEGGTRPSGV
jgi:serine/threonine protein kinase